MTRTVYFNDFVDTFMGSDTYKNKFTYNGLRALFDYLEDCENDTGETIDFDYVAIACDYAEYENLEAVQDEYSSIESMEDLQENTQVIEFEGGLIIQVF